MSFDNLTAAVACFEAELTHYDRSPRLAMGGARFTA